MIKKFIGLALAIGALAVIMPSSAVFIICGLGPAIRVVAKRVEVWGRTAA